MYGGPDGRRLTYGSLTARRRPRSAAVVAQLKPQSQLTLVGTPQRRIDALEIVTGRKQFAMDLDVPGALPTMLCRPPTINGTALSVTNAAAVQAMPGVTDVAIIPHTKFVAGGVAVRATTFGQCIDAIRALDVEWGPGTADGKSDADVLPDLQGAELPMTPALGHRRSTSASRSTSVRATRSRPTAPSPTCGPTAPRSGRPEVADLGPGAARADPGTAR